MYLKLFMILDLFSVTFFQEMVAFTQKQITLKCQPEEEKVYTIWKLAHTK